MSYDWSHWQELFAGDAGESLASVLENVRGDRLRDTQVTWANDSRTRTFCDLGLYAIYERQFLRKTSSKWALGNASSIFQPLTATYLADLAQRMIESPEEADGLSVQRWNDTWRHKHAYTQDLVAYLLRPQPSLRSIAADQKAIMSMVTGLELGSFIRQAARGNLEATTENPLTALISLVQSALPADPKVQKSNKTLHEAAMRSWSAFYETLFQRFGLRLRPQYQWIDVAELFATTADGALLRSRVCDGHPTLTTGDDLLGGAILAMTPSLFDVGVEEFERLTAT